MNLLELKSELTKLNIHITEDQLNKLEIYANMLIEYNKKFNLTAITKKEDIYLKHFYDSLTITKIIDLNHPLKILDIGTGAGFPGLVLKIIYPNLDVTLLDSNNKKITFLNAVITELKLAKIKCIYNRAEDLNMPEYFDVITSRAVAHLRILSELSIPYLKVGGHFIPMKSKIDTELAESKKTIEILNGDIKNIIKFNLPVENSERTILDIVKVSKTDPKYPRNYDKIVKKPLK